MHTGHTSGTAHSGSPDATEPCPRDPCAIDLDAALFAPPDSPGKLGWTLAIADDRLLAGAPNMFNVTHDPPRVYTLDAVDLIELGRVTAADPGLSIPHLYGQLSSALATADVEGDGVDEVAIGAHTFEGTTYDGSVFLIHGAPVTDTTDAAAASLILRGDVDIPNGTLFGTALAFLDLTGSGRADLVVGAGGVGAVYGYDPTRTGELGLAGAEWSIAGERGFGSRLAGWDGDGDGLAELLVTDAEDPVTGAGRVIRFASPLGADLQATDAATVWTSSAEESGLNFQPLGELGDLTGDGRPDLGLGARTATTGDLVRHGTGCVVEGGDTASRDVSALPLCGDGTEIGEAFGTSMAAGDLDGDGQVDLVVGAEGLFPAFVPGRIYGYLGPIRSLDPAAAAFVVHGDAHGDAFGSSTLLHDADGDGRSEVYVGADGRDRGLGAVFRFRAEDLLR